AKTTLNNHGAGGQETPMAATYDAANRMSTVTLTIGGASKSYTLTHDANGNLTTKQNTADSNDRTAYTWDSNNRLTQIAQPGLTASFSYDAFGRRIQSSIIKGGSTSTVQYLYEGFQSLGEIRDGKLSHRLLTGLSMDETIARMAINTSGNKDAASSRLYMIDALNSVIAQLNDEDSASVANSYAYSPYGESQTIGPDATGNPIQYTSRENDGTGLYFYRARYYDSALMRFVSSDPIGLLGGTNTFAYADGSPATKTDPLGLATHICKRPLGGSPGSYAPPLLNHTYVCVGSGENMICGSTTASSGGAMSNVFGSSPGKPTTSVTDYYKPEACEERQGDDSCLETCIANELKKPTRPKYGVGPSGTDCQEYTEDVVTTCEKRCVRR
ncbi:MAG: RHS repeat-associated core domain-containing protein, partial [Hydrogenophaga sp.]|uniref:RHS repeat domain-containing protein n=1 Tax=Hydrogenophaga sp. TaxID=1904254 RepID=UPI002AB9145A